MISRDGSRELNIYIFIEPYYREGEEAAVEGWGGGRNKNKSIFSYVWGLSLSADTTQKMFSSPLEAEQSLITYRLRLPHSNRTYVIRSLVS